MPVKTTVEILMSRTFPMFAAFIYSFKIADPFTFSLLKSLVIALIVKLLLYIFAKEINKIALKIRHKTELLIIKIKKRCRNLKKK